MNDLPPLPSIAPGLYRHYKGGEYEVLGVARHSETLEAVVVYRPLYNDSGWWVRPYAMFVEVGEFEGRLQPRFVPSPLGEGFAGNSQRMRCARETAARCSGQRGLQGQGEGVEVVTASKPKSPNEVVVRALVKSDAPAYRALMLHAYEAHPMEFTSTPAERASQPLSWWEKRIGDAQSDTRAFGAFVNAELAGAVALSFETREKARHKADLIGMYVSPAARGMGAGRALVHTVLDAARARPGVQQMLLTVTEGNAPAESLYAACGFERFGVEPRAVFADGAYRGKVHMWCDLSQACHPEQSEGSHPSAG